MLIVLGGVVSRYLGMYEFRKTTSRRYLKATMQELVFKGILKRKFSQFTCAF